MGGITEQTTSGRGGDAVNNGYEQGGGGDAVNSGQQAENRERAQAEDERGRISALTDGKRARFRETGVTRRDKITTGNDLASRRSRRARKQKGKTIAKGKAKQPQAANTGS